MKDGAIAQYFVDLTPLIGDRAADYSPGRWSIYSYQGEIYGIESSLTPSVLYYQPALFEAAGVEVPTTWEEVLNDVGPKLAANGSAFTFATNDPTWFQMYYEQRGGHLFDENGNFVMGEEENKQIAIEVADLHSESRASGYLHAGTRRRRLVGCDHPDCLHRRRAGWYGHARLVVELLPEAGYPRYGGRVADCD